MDADAKHEYLAQFLRREYGPSVAFARRQMGPALSATEMPEDIVQQACQHAFQRVEDFEPGAHGDDSTRAWFRKILLRVIAQAARKNLGTDRKDRQGLRLLEEELLQLEEESGCGTPSRCAGEAETLAFLQEAIDELKDEWQTVIRLRYLDGMTPTQIAESRGKSITAVEGLLKRAKDALRDAMGRSSLYYLPGRG